MSSGSRNMVTEKNNYWEKETNKLKPESLTDALRFKPEQSITYTQKHSKLLWPNIKIKIFEVENVVLKCVMEEPIFTWSRSKVLLVSMKFQLKLPLNMGPLAK